MTERLDFHGVRVHKSKICTVGESGVGKTSLIRRFVLDEFDDRYVATIGAKITKKELLMDGQGKGVQVEMTLWDIMGEKGFRELLREAYFQGCHGVFAVCDVTRSDTLFDLAGWIKAVFRVAGEVPVVFLANKIDLEDTIVVTEKDVAQMAAEYKAPHLMTSAKTGENVEEAFRNLAGLVVARADYHRR